MVNDRQSLDLTTFARATGGAVEWRISDAPVSYPEAVAAMEQRVAAIAEGRWTPVGERSPCTVRRC